ncbi:PAS domain-containing protein [Flavobacterium sp. LC2016-23]|uniref:CheR family methyltransferase n=1 Tax=Flavobacterium sp. LC2016-23 TaxID=2666330 RepID=UPI0012AEEBF6|nr:CheR family methyltransferase [Flavobacterium sp. LC2016-23]MRX41747.1 PAS domain-containing protein [Flavobacterium sp. LC2016-23]
METILKNQIETLTPDFPVVGIGAAAGGLDAFKKLLESLSEDSGMAYIIIQHQTADHPGRLTEMLARHSKIPVHEIIHTITLVPNHIYVIPENTTIVAIDGRLQLRQRIRSDKTNSPVDLFFESLAKVYKSFTIGVLLSGTTFDGTMGFKRIKESGGATMVQDPETAAFMRMPQSAIDADAADFVLSPENIPAQLLKISNSYNTNHGYTEEDHIPKSEEEIVFQIINLIFLKTGHDFRHYKQPTLRRRIARRMVIVGKDTLEDYYNLVRNDKAEQDFLFNDFLIPVTYFFRDQSFFDSLPAFVLPLLFQNSSNTTLRVWVAGCSTGEEAYSIAICIHEYILKTNSDLKVQIFASDVSEISITKARAAAYFTQDVQHISEERLNKYFVKHDGRYQISKIIRDMCIFATHNFTKDPPFARIDLVSCRNVLLYFDPFLQNKVLGSFHSSLKDRGLLFLGKSETAASAPDLFEAIGKTDRVYIRKFAPKSYVRESTDALRKETTAKIIPSETTTTEIDFKKIACDILCAQFTPASVVIDKDLEIIHFQGDNSPFLSHSSGKPNFNILKMVHDDLSFELRNAIIRVKEGKKTVSKENIPIKNQPYLISFKIIPLENDGNYLLVIFFQQEAPKTTGENQFKTKSTSQQRIGELETELARVRDENKRVTDEQQKTLEELQATSEALRSSSEELQILNEDLETATEELLSANEELLCVNAELPDRQDQLIAMRNYTESIVKTIRGPLLIIDKNFIIKSANPAFYKYFNTSENETEGQGFFEIGSGQWDLPDFKAQLLKMHDTEVPLKDFILAITCRGTGKKTMIVNARPIVNAKPEGMMVLAIEDITDLAVSNELVRAKNAELQRHNEQLKLFTSGASDDLQEPLRKIHMFSKRFYENEKNLSETGKHNLERILFLSANMSQLITDLINYSKITFIEKEFKSTDMNLLLRKTVTDLKESISEKHAVISLDVLPLLSVIPHQIQQLFTNLITNSIKYAQEGVVPELKIESRQPSEEELIEIGANDETKYVKICLSDNGIGFEKEYENRIFAPFYRLHNKDASTGSGLGLTLVKKIMENHHGFIQAKSTLNEGTQMHLYLPV